MPARTGRQPATPQPKPKPKPKPTAAPSVDIVGLVASPATRPLGDKLMKVDLEKGNANGRLDYAELPLLDAASRTRAAALMMSPNSVEARPSLSVVAPDKPTALKRLPERYNRFHFKDEQLINPKGLPGDAVNWVSTRDWYNPVWASKNNRADPALLRVKARLLELTDGGDLRPKTRELRNKVLKEVKQQLTSGGLDAMELAYFPAEQALAIVKRLAVAAGVDVSSVLVSINGAQVRLPAFERQLGDLTAVPIMPYKKADLPRTAEQQQLDAATAAREDAEHKRQLSYFTENPKATLADYSREQAYLDHRRTRDGGFWAKMEAMIRKADVGEAAHYLDHYHQ